MKTGTLSEYAAHAAVSPAYVTKLKKQGRIVLVKQDGRELVNFDATDRLVANTADLARARNGANAKPDREPTAPAPEEPPAGAAALTGGGGGAAGVDAVFRKAQAQERVFSAKKAELEFKRLSGELLEKAGVERTVFNMFRLLRDHAFQAPQRAAVRVMTMSDPREIENVISEELRKAFDGWDEKMAERLAARSAP
ncbi:hypothetical protein ACFJIS_18945 [Variovorax boronicumulans]|uniref:hypothetical protein n=1 Tax=Variovorax boronicumulans TaxID=436515 RepID=UPI0036F32229